MKKLTDPLRILLPMAMSLALVTPASALPDPQIFDFAGDANGIQGTSVQTDPVSYAPADLLEAILETTYVEVPVGENGIDYQATGFRIHIRTTEPPRSDTFTMRYAVDALAGECKIAFSGWVAGEQTPATDDRPGTVVATIGPYNTTQCPFTQFTHPSWTSVVQPNGTLVLSMPFAPMAGTPMSELLRPGLVVPQPNAWAFLSPCVDAALGFCGDEHLDHSPAGQTYVVGEDVPEDIPCTKGCP